MKLKYISPFAAILLLLATQFMTAGCDRNEDDITSSGQQQPDNTGNGNTDKSNALCIVTTKQPFADETGTRASTDFGGTYATTFETGDEIGVIAVKNGAVLDDCNNVKLTYNATGSKWEGDNPVYFKDGATYIAYSPYRAVMDGKKSTQEIYDAFDVSTNQSKKTLFTANDLMTSTTCTANKTAKTLTIAFEHRLAMLEIPAKYEQMYARTTGGWTYPIKGGKLWEQQMRVNNVVTTFFKSVVDTDWSQNAYVCLLKPVTKIEIKLGYNIKSRSGTSVYFEYTFANQTFIAGQRRKILPTKTRDMVPGDYFYDDGSIFPSNITTYDLSLAPYTKNEGCIGIVFCVGAFEIKLGGTPYHADNLSNYADSEMSKTDAIHGYVVALSDANDGNTCTWGSKGIVVGADFLSGYLNTRQIKSMTSPAYNASNFPAVWHACNYSVSIPVLSSGWYLPSNTELVGMRNQLTMLNAAFLAAGSSAFYNENWSSWEHVNGKPKEAYYIIMNYGIEFKAKDAYAMVRPIFTF